MYKRTIPFKLLSLLILRQPMFYCTTKNMAVTIKRKPVKKKFFTERCHTHCNLLSPMSTYLIGCLIFNVLQFNCSMSLERKDLNLSLMHQQVMFLSSTWACEIIFQLKGKRLLLLSSATSKNQFSVYENNGFPLCTDGRNYHFTEVHKHPEETSKDWHLQQY